MPFAYYVGMPNASGAPLRESDMMAHLMDALEDGQDIGHYGRLVFTMVAYRFLPDEQVAAYLCKDPSVDEREARALVEQVRSRGYNPPRRERILDWQRQQDFPIVPNPDDPDSGNVYRDLHFPDDVYQDIEEYHEAKAEVLS